MKYTISGTIRLGKRENRQFTKEIEANSENHAKELLFSDFGANHGIKRTEVKIKEIKGETA